MGGAFSNLFRGLFGKKEMRILMLGLQNAGKTTILHKLQLGEIVTTIPDIGTKVETVEYRNIGFTVWDVGGPAGSQVEPLSRDFFPNTQALIFVVDSSDRERIEEARVQLNNILYAPGMQDATLLVFANKQDLPGAMNAAEVSHKLGLHNIRARGWWTQAACATSGDGLYEGLDWLSHELKKNKSLIQAEEEDSASKVHAKVMAHSKKKILAKFVAHSQKKTELAANSSLKFTQSLTQAEEHTSSSKIHANVVAHSQKKILANFVAHSQKAKLAANSTLEFARDGGENDVRGLMQFGSEAMASPKAMGLEESTRNHAASNSSLSALAIPMLLFGFHRAACARRQRKSD